MSVLSFGSLILSPIAGAGIAIDQGDLHPFARLRGEGGAKRRMRGGAALSLFARGSRVLS
jgi:hypothetical protein